MLRFRHAVVAAAIGLVSTAAPCSPVTYTIVSKISRVSFNIEHQGFIQLFGTLRLSPGTFTFDSDDWSKSSVAVSLPIISLDMGDALWNNQIRGDDSWAKLFNSAAIAFRSTRLERTDSTRGTMYGDLTLAGVTRPVALQMRINKIGKNEVSEYASVGISATTTLKRSQFGLDAYADLVGDELAVQIQVEGAVGPDQNAQDDKAAVGVRH